MSWKGVLGETVISFYLHKTKMKNKWHKLKIEEVFARRIHQGEKTCEVRRDDKDFQKGDIIVFSINSFEDGQWELAPQLVTHVLRGGQYGIEQGYVVMSIKPLPQNEN